MQSHPKRSRTSTAAMSKVLIQEIDPTQMKGLKEAKLLAAFLASREEKIFYKGNLFDFNDPQTNTLMKIQLSHMLISRFKKNSTTPCYSIIPNKDLMRGNSGGIWELEGTLVSSNGAMINERYKSRIIKMHPQNMFFEDEEATLTKTIGYLHGKEPTKETLKRPPPILYQVQKRIPGVNFLQYLRSARQMQFWQLFIISINLLQALKKIHQYGIIHRDIHACNVMIDEKTLKVKIIDLGYATTSSNPKHSGVFWYASPECITKAYPYSQSSDFYSVVMILLNIWGFPYQFPSKNERDFFNHLAVNTDEWIVSNWEHLVKFNAKDSTAISTSEKLQYIQSQRMRMANDISNRLAVILSNLFSTTPFPEELKINLKTHFEKMLSIDPAKRGSIDDAISVFKKGLCQLSNIDEKIINSAEETKEQIKKIKAANNASKLEGAFQLINKALDQIEDNPKALLLFLILLKLMRLLLM